VLICGQLTEPSLQLRTHPTCIRRIATVPGARPIAIALLVRFCAPGHSAAPRDVICRSFARLNPQLSASCIGCVAELAFNHCAASAQCAMGKLYGVVAYRSNRQHKSTRDTVYSSERWTMQYSDRSGQECDFRGMCYL
jgi:hypothetical protein